MCSYAVRDWDLQLSGPACRILHIGGSAADALIVEAALIASASDRYEVEWAGTLAAGLERLTRDGINAVLLDVQRPDRNAIAGLENLRLAAPGIPVLVIGADEDRHTPRLVIDAGARDYLLTRHLDSYWLPHAIVQAIHQRPSDEALVAETERVGATLSFMGDGLISTDVSGSIAYLNRTAEAMTGWSLVEAGGRPLNDVLEIIDSVTRARAVIQVTWAGTEAQEPSLVPCSLLRRDGTECAIEHSAAPIHDHRRRVVGTRIVLRDTSAVRALALRMAHLASHDQLTDLPNRLLLADRLARALGLAERHSGRLAVLFIDIDRFKLINDTLGHLIGDELLRSVAKEVSMCVRSSDTVSRYGGDEFVVVLAELQHAEDAAKGAQKIIATLARPHTFSGHEIQTTVSIGISVYPDDGQDAETLLTRADMAMYHAKEEGRDGYRFFEPRLNIRAIKRQSIEAGLRRALDHHEFELVYQPKMNLKTGAVVGIEALIRWHHPNRGLLDPIEFVAIAEDCGLIGPIGRWVVHAACQQAQSWNDAGLAPIPVSVNVSGVEFRNRGLLKNITETLQATSLDPSQLEIELTESTLMTDADATTSVLHGLKALGVQLTIDDFGTGWSSLNYLRQFPIDALKIDTSFVREVTTDAKAALIVGAVIRLGKSLTHRVIAEGIETQEQLAFLQTEECDEGQGYYLSRPLNAQKVGRLLEASQNRLVS